MGGVGAEGGAMNWLGVEGEAAMVAMLEVLSVFGAGNR